MNIKSVGAGLALAILSTTAFAADLPSRRAVPLPPPVPVFSFTGVYVGGQLGYQFGNDQDVARATATGIGLATNNAYVNGVVGGGHIGYNFSTQSLPLFNTLFNPLLGLGNTAFGAFGFASTGGVVGIEGDVDGADARQNIVLGATPPGFTPFNRNGIATTHREDIEGTVRGRLGIAIDHALFYATGGVAFAGITNTYTNTINGLSQSTSRTRVGYTVGGGVEYYFTNNISARVEYRYTDLGSYTDVLGVATAGGVAVRHRDTNNRVQAGLSYKFSSPILAPVVARY